MTPKIAFAASIFAALPAFAEAPEVEFSGYRAVYELSFDSAAVNSGIIGAEGRYVFDLEDACEGYATNERLVVRIARTEDRVLTDYRLSAFESAEGDQYRFVTETEFNGRTGQEAEGNLTVDKAANTAKVDYAKADDVSFDDPVLPPIAHVRSIITTALSGEERHAAMIFDGDIDSPVFYAVTRIAEASESTDLTAKGSEALSDLRRWTIDSVYYPPETGGEGEGATPEFAFNATLFENGVVTDLHLDYMEFSLKAELSELELRSSGC